MAEWPNILMEDHFKKLTEEDDEADAASIGTLRINVPHISIKFDQKETFQWRLILYEVYEFQENNEWKRNGIFLDNTIRCIKDFIAKNI